jgi:ureidoacrylate peracid hydrolase
MKISFPTLEEKLDPKNSALLIIDVQNDFCHKEGFFGRHGEQDYSNLSMIGAMKLPLETLLEAARQIEALRIFIRAVYDPIYVSRPFAEKLSQLGAYGRACLNNTWGAQIWDEIVPDYGPRELEVVKHRYSAFRDTDLNAILRANEIRTVIATGVATSGCVCSTARDAVFHDFYLIIPRDATADFSVENHDSHLRKLQSTFGEVIDTETIIQIWRQIPTGST